jgi:uncharacterized secreted protein with C-terminal beta-propeller domain
MGDCFNCWGPQFSANDDGFVIKKDSEQQELRVLANDADRVSYWQDTYSITMVDVTGDDNLVVESALPEDEPSERETLRIKSVTSAENGSVEISEDGLLLFTPRTGFTGIDRFSYTITNADGETDAADVFVNVVTPLFSMRDWFRVDEASADNELDVLQNDSHNVSAFYGSDDGELSFQIVAVGQSSHGGTVNVSEDGQRIIYSPEGTYEGLESFTYTIESDEGYVAEATVHVQVTTLDDANSHQVWKGQIEQQLLEASVQQSGHQFGWFAQSIYPRYDYWYASDAIPLRLAVLNDAISQTPVTKASELVVAGNSSQLTNSGSFNRTEDVDFSTTNIQVAGVDEGDIVKTDGDYLYVLSDWFDKEAGSFEHHLIIADVRDPGTLSVVSRYEFDGDVLELYLHDDRVTVLSQSGDELLVTVLDASDRVDPTLLYTSSIEGTLESTRAIGDFVYVIANVYNSMQLPTPITVCAAEDEGCFYETKQQFFARIQDGILESVPDIETRDANGDVVDNRNLLDFSQLLELTDFDWHNVSAVVTLDVTTDELGPIASTAFSHGRTSEIYVSTEAIYLLEQTWNSGTQTEIHKLSLDDGGGVRWAASGSVSGRVLNQFSVDEYNGYLRVATTARRDNNLYVLQQMGEQLEVVGSVEGLARGEQIYSARFDGERGFVVTYRKVDPLFVFDLSDPTNPEVLGALKVSGYSNYLQLIDGNHLLGIGRDANGKGLFQEIQVSLFDISDFENPTLLHRYSFEGGRKLWSPIMQDAWNLGTHHGVSYFASHKTLVMPIYEGDHAGWSWVYGGQEADVSMRVLDIDIEDGITSLGQVAFDAPFDPHQARAVRIGDVLYSISPEAIKANELRNPKNMLSELFVGEGATDDSFEMQAAEEEPIDLLANDLVRGSEAEAMQIVSIEQPLEGGTVTLDMDDASVSFVADDDFMGDATFSYVMGVRDDYRDVGSVRVHVRPNWHNADKPLDIDRDGEIAPKDALFAINAIETLGSGSVKDLEKTASAHEALMGGKLRLDVNGDGYFVPGDILALRNHFLLARQPILKAAGKGPTAVQMLRASDWTERRTATMSGELDEPQANESVIHDDVVAPIAHEVATVTMREIEPREVVLSLLDDELLELP